MGAAAVVWRRPRGDDPLYAAVRTGCQGALHVLLIASVTFPSFSQLAITPAMGVLLAICAAPAGDTAHRDPVRADEGAARSAAY